jgi:CBS domain-containing protein
MSENKINIKVKDIMTKDVISVSLDTKITDVADILFKNRFQGVPVLSGGKIMGMILQKDFFTRDSSNPYLPSYFKFLRENKEKQKLSKEETDKVDRLLNSEAKDIMSEDYVSILQDMDIQSLLFFFRTTKFPSIPVIDDKNNLVGIITVSDVLNLLKDGKLEK